MLVKCVVCNLPGSFYIKQGKDFVKIADQLIRVSLERGELAKYLHKKCLGKP